jgi:hypothetical protein
MRNALALGVLAAAALARPDGWHRTMEDGLKAAKKSGKPVLVVTIWKEKL